MDAQVKPITADDLFNMPEDKWRYELVEGQLIEMTPVGDEHGVITFNFGGILRNFVTQNGLGRIKGGEVGFKTRKDSNTVRAADVAYTSYERVPKGETQKGYSDVPPEIVVEVISPGDLASEVEQKTQEWLAFGVLMVWNAYPDSRRIHVFKVNEPSQILSAEDWVKDGDVLLGFKVKAADFFED